MEERNAVIEFTTLGFEDHGCTIFWLHLSYGGSSQGFGGHVLDAPNPNKGERPSRRIGSAFGMDAIMRVLEVTGVSIWEKLPGTSVRVRGETWGKIDAIGHYLKDDWLNLEELADHHNPSPKTSLSQ